MPLPRSAYSTMASIWDPFSFFRSDRSLAPGKASCHVWRHPAAYRELHITMWELRSLAYSQQRTEGWRDVRGSWRGKTTAQICRWLSPNWQPPGASWKDQKQNHSAKPLPHSWTLQTAEMRRFVFSFLLPNLGTTSSRCDCIVSTRAIRQARRPFSLGQWLTVAPRVMRT